MSQNGIKPLSPAWALMLSSPASPAGDCRAWSMAASGPAERRLSGQKQWFAIKIPCLALAFSRTYGMMKNVKVAFAKIIGSVFWQLRAGVPPNTKIRLIKAFNILNTNQRPDSLWTHARVLFHCD